MLRASNIVDGLAFQPVAGRLAQYLLEQTSPGKSAAARHQTLDEMAAHIGTTREVVCRTLHSFSDDGLIRITRTEYNITDRQALEQMTRQVKG
jgi:CRP-like cAMP-binding protein